MHIKLETFTVNKQFPLTISRGTTTQTTNLWLKLHHENITGWGEASPFSMDGIKYTAIDLEREFQAIAPLLDTLTPWQHQAIINKLDQTNLSNPARAALDTSLYDWQGKALGLPLWQL